MKNGKFGKWKFMCSGISFFFFIMRKLARINSYTMLKLMYLVVRVKYSRQRYTQIITFITTSPHRDKRGTNYKIFLCRESGKTEIVGGNSLLQNFIVMNFKQL